MQARAVARSAAEDGAPAGGGTGGGANGGANGGGGGGAGANGGAGASGAGKGEGGVAGLSHKDTHALRSLFVKHDADFSGFIDQNELLPLLVDLGVIAAGGCAAPLPALAPGPLPHALTRVAGLTGA